MAVHQWRYRYQAPLPGGLIVTEAKPGQQIARAITEIQDTIDNLTGADGEGEALGAALPDPAGRPDGYVAQVKDGAYVLDYVRATA